MTDIEICNLALGSLGTAGISGFEDDSDEARACKAAYTTVRDAVLADAPWTFSTRQKIFAPPDADAPLFRWAYKFTIPSDVAAVFKADDGTGEFRIEWEVLDGAIHADDATVYAIVGMKVEDTAKFSPAFCLALADRLAFEICIPLTENRALKLDLWASYTAKIKDARRSDGRQGKSERVRSDYLARRR